jgi:hypothetical protein
MASTSGPTSNTTAGETVTGPKIEQCQTYNDPSADVIITTSDNVKMRVHSYVLKGQRWVHKAALSPSPVTSKLN